MIRFSHDLKLGARDVLEEALQFDRGIFDGGALDVRDDDPVVAASVLGNNKLRSRRMDRQDEQGQDSKC